MAKIADRYQNEDLKVEAGTRLHRLVAMLFDTYYDDLTDNRIAQLEALAESWRWMNADGERV
jgi:hypothetical protein